MMGGEAKIARVLRVNSGSYKRVIVVSDVHGNAHLLERLLDELAFSKEDVLFLLGDLIEKGKNSLETVRLAMRLCEARNAHVLQGNCDTLWDDLASGLYCVDVNGYIDWRRDSLIADMCAEQKLDRHALGSKRVCEALNAHYADVFAWLRNLPHIIETERAVFVHAGLDAGDLSGQQAERCLRRDAFLEEPLRFGKLVVCGHMPTCNYCHLTGDRLSYVPLALPGKNMLAIDGGNAVKSFGQLNAVVFEGENVSFFSVDDLEERLVTGEQAESADYASIVWNHNEVELLEERGESALCRVLFSGKTLSIPRRMLFEMDGRLRSYDYTSYCPRLEPGERVKLLEAGETVSLIKHGGIIGWAKSAILT